MAAMRHYEYFGFLQQVRLAAWRGPTRLDGLLEQLWWLVQNWPTVATLIPRMALCIALLLSYTDNDATGVATRRDAAFFTTDNELTQYACIVLLINAAWAAYRTGLVLASGLLLALLTCAGGAPRALGVGGQPKRRSTLYSEDDVFTPTFSGQSTQPEETRANWAWRWRTERRIRAAADYCASSTGPAWVDEAPLDVAIAAAPPASVPEMQQVGSAPSPFSYRPTSGDGASQPLSDRDERALLDDAALNAYRNSAGSSQPPPSTVEQQSVRRVPPPTLAPLVLPPGARSHDGHRNDSDESLTIDAHQHVVPGSPNASAQQLAGPHEIVAAPPVTPVSTTSALPDDASTASSSAADSVRLSGMHPAPTGPSLSPEQIAILRRNLHDQQHLSDDDDSDYARSDPSGLQVRL